MANTLTFDDTVEQLKSNKLINTDSYAYSRIHLWVNRVMGKAVYCSNDSSHEAKRFHWANISGEYKKDLADWRQLCASCNIKEAYDTTNLREIKRLQAIGNTSHNTRVECLETGIIYDSVKQAAEHQGIHRTGISMVLTGRGKTAGGYRWRYA